MADEAVGTNSLADAAPAAGPDLWNDKPVEHSRMSDPVQERAPGETSKDTLNAVEEAWNKAEQMAQEKADAEKLEPEPEKETEKEKTARQRDERGKFAAKEAKAAAEKPADDKKPAEADDSDESVDKFKPHKGAHPKTIEIMDALKAQSKERGQRNRELKQQLAEFQAKIAEASKTSPLGEAERKELEELRERDFIRDPEKSSKITREFDAPLAEVKTGLEGLLQKHGLPEQLLEQFKKLGPAFQDAAWWEKAVLNNELVPWPDREKFKRMLGEHYAKSEARDMAIKAAATNKETFQKTLEEREKQEGEQFNKEMLGEIDRLQKEQGEWAMPKAVPAEATAEQRKALEAHNAAYEATKAKVVETHKNIVTGGAKGLAQGLATVAQATYEATKAAAEAADYKAKVADLEKRLAEAEGQVSRIKTAGKISRINTAHAAAPRAPSAPSSVDESWERAMAAASAAA